MRAEALAAALRRIGGALQRIPRGWAWLPAGSWAALIWFLSSRPPPPVGTRGPLGSLLANFLHAPEFGLLALWLSLLAPRRGGWPDLARRWRTGILLAVAAYAAVDELHQSLTPDRDGSALDALTDVAGAFATLACIARAGGSRADDRNLARSFGLGLAACLAAAALATFAPRLFPDTAWL